MRASSEEPSSRREAGACAGCHEKLKQSCQMSASTQPTSSMSRESYVLILASFYAALAMCAWIFTCVLSVRPVTTQDYSVKIGNGSPYPFSTSDDGFQKMVEISRELRSLYSRNQQWYRAARVLQSLVGVLTLPLTTAVCSSTAVVFIQRRQSHGSLSLRQTMALADKTWTNIPSYAKIFPFVATTEWNRYGSSLLQLAIFLNVLGVVTSPMQQIFLSTKVIKTPTVPQTYDFVGDIPNQFQEDDYPRTRNPLDDAVLDNTTDSNKVVVLTRAAMASATTADFQSLLWYDLHNACPPELLGSNGACSQLAVSFGHFDPLGVPPENDAFLAQLPVGFNSGLIRQFAPRINSSTKFTQIASHEFSRECEQTHGSFFMDYASAPDLRSTPSYGWAIQACMPGDLARTPWKATRSRQDFSEDLFLNMTLKSSEAWNNTFYKLTLNTTAGYFELPNYMNGEVAGSLLDKDPNDLCGIDCMTQGSDLEAQSPILHHDFRRNEPKSGHSTDGPIRPLETVKNKGPLLTIALAMFGEGSFLQQNSFGYKSPSQIHDDLSRSTEFCTNLLPLQFILDPKIWTSMQDMHHASGTCIRENVVNWMRFFHLDIFSEYLGFHPNNPASLVESSFKIAAFLANKAWMESKVGSLAVSYDLGADSQVPSISRAGIIIISCLLGLDLLILVPLAAYAAWTPRWTSQLDSFAMMRIGATLGDKVPLLMKTDKTDIKILDELPGWIGDNSQEDDPAGTLALGGLRPLADRKDGLFKCYAENATPFVLKIRQAVVGVFRRR
ncbi:uncharacterized protein N7506_011451 [Penicillium brevicompactum]|uniref:uncharacterized protein n=1 Tax=Penicillium brevicompactum TaxID=5074 RepID=UPI00253F7006|nr:uncharacterized protein N7506_011451 [Penicillium brevicompactum]KAJ5318747.1 hypothetical protein N7506_011451 [Penicillium brevicompactum]